MKRFSKYISTWLMLSCVAVFMTACNNIERIGIPDPLLKNSHLAAEDRESRYEVDHSIWAQFLKHYTERDEFGVVRVRYGDVNDEVKGLLREYLVELSKVDPGSLNRYEQLAFWVNLYNARMVKLIVDHYPLRSVKTIRFSDFHVGPWAEELVVVDNRTYTLEDIKNRILRPLWILDPRIHYVLFDGAVGSPNLPEEPYTGENMQAALRDAATAFINNFRGVNVTDDGHVILSKIYVWFRKDFGNSDDEVLDHLRKYARGRLKYDLLSQDVIDMYKYDWSLNDAADAGKVAPMRILPHNELRYN